MPLSIQFCILTGAVYIALVFTSGYWHNLIPTSWAIFRNAVHAIGDYLTFRYPPLIADQPFNAVQKLSYFLVIFVLAPLQVATGAAMSPAVIGPLLGMRGCSAASKGPRSLHFLGLCAFTAFVLIHTAMVIIHGVPHEFAAIVLGSYRANQQLALAVGLSGIFLVLVFHVIVTWFSLRYRRRTQRLLGGVVDPFERVLSRVFG